MSSLASSGDSGNGRDSRSEGSGSGSGGGSGIGSQAVGHIKQHQHTLSIRTKKDDYEVPTPLPRAGRFAHPLYQHT